MSLEHGPGQPDQAPIQPDMPDVNEALKLRAEHLEERAEEEWKEADQTDNPTRYDSLATGAAKRAELARELIKRAENPNTAGDQYDLNGQLKATAQRMEGGIAGTSTPDAAEARRRAAEELRKRAEGSDRAA